MPRGDDTDGGLLFVQSSRFFIKLGSLRTDSRGEALLHIINAFGLSSS